MPMYELQLSDRGCGLNIPLDPVCLPAPAYVELVISQWPMAPRGYCLEKTPIRTECDLLELPDQNARDALRRELIKGRPQSESEISDGYLDAMLGTDN